MTPFNSFTGFHLAKLPAGLTSEESAFNSFTGFHGREFVDYDEDDEQYFQFLHRIPRSSMLVPYCRKNRSFNSFTGFHLEEEKRKFYEELENFQFLHRIPQEQLWSVDQQSEESFQFLHRIPR